MRQPHSKNLQPEMVANFLPACAKNVEYKKNVTRNIGGNAVKVAMFGHKRVPSREGGIEIVNFQGSACPLVCC